MTENDAIYENLHVKSLKYKTQFLSFPWKSKNGFARNKHRNVLERSKSVTTADRTEHTRHRGVSDKQTALPVSSSEEDSFTTGYHTTYHANRERCTFDTPKKQPDDVRTRFFSTSSQHREPSDNHGQSQKPVRHSIHGLPAKFTAFETVQRESHPVHRFIRDVSIPQCTSNWCR